MPAPGLDHDAVAAALLEARARREPIPPLTESHPGIDLADAHRVQRAFAHRLEQQGGRLVGWKLGLTSAPMQAMFGVDSPDHGPVLDTFLLPDGAALDVGTLIAPKAEAEIAVRLAEPLAGPDCTAADVARAVAGYSAAIEVVDSRIADWRIALPDTVADLASIGAVALSSRVVEPGEWDVRLLGMVLTRDAEVVGTGAGAATLGSPLNAVAWLVRTLHATGDRLEAGQFVITGALHAAVPLEAGSTYRAEFDRLGAVTVVAGGAR